MGQINREDHKCKVCQYKTDLHKKHKIIESILECSSDCIVIWDTKHNFLYINQEAIDYIDDVKLTREEIIGKNIKEVLCHLPDFLNLWISRIDKVADTQKAMGVTDKTDLNGKTLYSRSIISPIKDDKGRVIAVSAVYRDITAEKQTQQQLQESKRRYKELYDNARIALYRTRLSDGKLLEGNKQLAKLLGYESLEQCLKTYYSADFYVNPERREDLIKLLEEKGQVKDFEVESQKIDGSPLWVSISAHLNTEKGYIEGTARDITIFKKLTKTENEILQLVLKGKSNKEIADELVKSVRTIEDHRSHIMKKLGANNLVELTKKVIKK
jgi:PAS domain S-box-containing protein